METFLKKRAVKLPAVILATAFLMGSFFVANNVLASGGTVLVVVQNSQVNISTDAVNGSSVSVGTITMTEDNSGVFSGTSGLPKTIALTPPSGFIFDATSIADVEIIGDSGSTSNINDAASGTHFLV